MNNKTVMLIGTIFLLFCVKNNMYSALQKNVSQCDLKHVKTIIESLSDDDILLSEELKALLSPYAIFGITGGLSILFCCLCSIPTLMLCFACMYDFTQRDNPCVDNLCNRICSCCQRRNRYLFTPLE